MPFQDLTGWYDHLRNDPVYGWIANLQDCILVNKVDACRTYPTGTLLNVGGLARPIPGSDHPASADIDFEELWYQSHRTILRVAEERMLIVANYSLDVGSYRACREVSYSFLMSD
jgi:hypothetical protein